MNATMSTYNVTINRTDTADFNSLRIIYTVSTVVTIIAIFTIIYNVLIITTFIRDPRIRTPFNYYLLNLSISDTCMAAFEMTIFIAYTLAGSWKFGRKMCTLFIWFNWTCSAVAANGVMLICTDRLWALFKPVSYRNHRSNKMTFIICASNWAYIQIGLLPLIIVDRVYYALDETVCLINLQAQQTYVLVLLFAYYYVPLLSVVIGYLAAVVEVIKRGRKKAIPTVGTSEVGQTPPKKTLDSGLVAVQSKQADRLDKKMYQTLSLLALSLLLFWTPACVYFMISTIWDGYFDLEFYMIGLCLEFASCAVNPVVYHFGIPSIRAAMKSQFGRRC